MNLQNYPQYHLYLLTLNLLNLKEQIIPENCDEWCINATIINRAYYSSYLYCELWLKEIKNFKPKKPWEIGKKEKRISEHKQVRKALKKFGEKNIESELKDLVHLRKKADYKPFDDISSQEVNKAINHMDEIFSQLKFQ